MHAENELTLNISLFKSKLIKHNSMHKEHFQLCRKSVKLIWVQNMMERSLGYVQVLSSACSLSQMWLWHVVQICILLTALPSFLLWKEEAKASRCWKWKHKMCLVKTSHFRSWCTMHVCIYWCQLGYQVPSSERQKNFDLQKIMRC